MYKVGVGGRPSIWDAMALLSWTRFLSEGLLIFLQAVSMWVVLDRGGAGLLLEIACFESPYPVGPLVT
jgi:hypothetical protein